MNNVIHVNFRPQNDDFVPECEIPEFLKQGGDTTLVKSNPHDTPAPLPPCAGGEGGGIHPAAPNLDGIAVKAAFFGFFLICLLIYVGC